MSTPSTETTPKALTPQPTTSSRPDVSGATLARNLIGYHIVWLGSVLGAAQGAGWIGPLLAGAFLAQHVYLWRDPRGATCRTVELRSILLIAALGYLGDSLILITAGVSFPDHRWDYWLAPLWILGLWVSFAATLSTAFGFVGNRHWIPAGMGLFGGPTAYWIASSIGALHLAGSLHGLTTIGAGWAGLLVALFAIHQSHRRTHDAS